MNTIEQAARAAAEAIDDEFCIRDGCIRDGKFRSGEDVWNCTSNIILKHFAPLVAELELLQAREQTCMDGLRHAVNLQKKTDEIIEAKMAVEFENVALERECERLRKAVELFVRWDCDQDGIRLSDVSTAAENALSDELLEEIKQPLPEKPKE